MITSWILVGIIGILSLVIGVLHRQKLELQKGLEEERRVCDEHIDYLNGECNRLSRELSESELECKNLRDEAVKRLEEELSPHYEDVATPPGNPNDPQSRGEAIARGWTT